jgi:hypothetical protein
MQIRIFRRVVTFIINKKNPDFGISFRITKLEPEVIGFTSLITGTGKDIYNGQKHIGIIDADDISTLENLAIKIKEIQEKFKDFVGDAYIYETSPKKYSVHFYNPASYWDWLKVIHFSRDTIDEQYCKFRLLRDNLVMRFTPKSNGFTPRLVRTVRTKHPQIELTHIKEMFNDILNKEQKKAKTW